MTRSELSGGVGRLRSVVFRSAVLRNAVPRSAVLRNAVLRNAVLRSVVLRNVSENPAASSLCGSTPSERTADFNNAFGLLLRGEVSLAVNVLSLVSYID